MNEKCKICGRESEITYISSRGINKIDCPLCGTYNMTREFYDDFDGYRFSQTLRAKISTVLKHRSIVKPGVITTFAAGITREEAGFSFVNIDDIYNEFPKNLVERADMALRNLEYITEYTGESVRLNMDRDLNIFTMDSFVADSFSYITAYLKEKGYISLKNSTLSEYWVTILPLGWERLWEINQQVNTESNNAFVAMWFDRSMDSVYENAIAKAIEECGYNPVRIDRQEHNNKIDDEIIANINQSKFVICDFTGQRGGVYFEAGYAKGIGLPVIWTCKSNEIENLHFDTRQFNHISWDNEEDFKIKLINRIRASFIKMD